MSGLRHWATCGEHRNLIGALGSVSRRGSHPPVFTKNVIGVAMSDKDNKPPERIYLQCYESDGTLRDFISDDVTWCVDQINNNDVIYILALTQPPRAESSMEE